MENKLYENIRHLPKKIKKDKDCLAIFSGPPGEGKSTLAQQIGYVIDPTININSIYYESENLIKYCIKNKDNPKLKGRVIIHDEVRESLSALIVMVKKTRAFMNFIYENRQLNLYMFILTGDFFDLPKSIITQRATFLTVVYEAGEFDNGYFKFYNRAATKSLYMKGKRFHDYGAHPHTFRGTFPRFYTVDEEQYRKKKKDHLTLERYIESAKTKELSLTELILEIRKRNPKVTHTQIITALNCSSSMPTYVKQLETRYSML